MTEEGRIEPDIPMTWAEFVREIERHGVGPDTPIRRIELYRPQRGENFINGNPLDCDGAIDVDG